MLHRCKNGQAVLLAYDGLDMLVNYKEFKPSSVLISSSVRKTLTDHEFKTFIHNLILSKAISFCCIGGDAERLHDEIDDLVCENVFDSSQAILTTFHKLNTIDEAVYYFIHLSTLHSDSRNNSLLALISNQDIEIKKALLAS